MENQISIDDPEAVLPVPELWDCHATCKRFGEKTDHPSWLKEERCMLPGHNDLVHVEFNNRCFIYCKLYERK